MKIIHNLSFIFIFFITSTITSQTYEVTYIESKNIESKLKKIKDPLLKAKIKSQLKASGKFVLTAYNKQSLYEATEQMATAEVQNNIKVISIRSKKSKVFKNLKSNTYLEETSILEDEYLISDVLPEIQWELTNDRKKVGGYNCKKALGQFHGRSIEAWYTVEIPISDGPYIYQGLPGLILELHTPYKSFTTENIEIGSAPVKFQKLSIGKKVTRNDFAVVEKKKIKEMTLHATTKM
ncbi:GLPGLI family protein [uncultured Aquimarina sp.]|uniref:GLPGLI family protein n=1 Tax=uncultured Aquimarina sp. TaxID=575652 RepID=UPI0026306D34|nr:GLPGLI family protein [uncultured Aquimarina sp.]